MNLSNLRRTLDELPAVLGEVRRLAAAVDSLRRAVGRIESRQVRQDSPSDPTASEFQVYSQWGEDGILEWLVQQVPIARKVFVEFGVESYAEANSRWLLVQHLWAGLVIDGSSSNLELIRRHPIYWQCNLKAVQAFVTRENIDALIGAEGIAGEIGLLSVDIDGVDYWVWEAITSIHPALVVTEYNARFGPERKVTVPYDATFERAKAHPSCIYYGASISALAALGRRKGYALVAGNRAGNNCFFVRRDLLPSTMRELTPAEAWRQNQFREGRDVHGRLAFMTPDQEAALVQSLPLVEVE